MPQWIAAAAADDIDPEDVIPFEHDGSDDAIYRSPDYFYYAPTALALTRNALWATPGHWAA